MFHSSTIALQPGAPQNPNDWEVLCHTRIYIPPENNIKDPRGMRWPDRSEMIGRTRSARDHLELPV